MKTDNNISIKDDMIIVIKESIKFALVGITLLFIDMEKIHTYDKIVECNRRIIIKVHN